MRLTLDNLPIVYCGPKNSIDTCIKQEKKHIVNGKRYRLYQISLLKNSTKAVNR